MTATTKVTRLGEAQVVELDIPVEPTPAPRPRVSARGIAYYPASYKAFMKAIKDATPPSAVTFTGELMVEVECVCKPIAKSKFTTPMGDCDNLAKGPMDALKDLGYYQDDRQIVDLHVTKRFPREGEVPHIIVNIQEIE